MKKLIRRAFKDLVDDNVVQIELRSSVLYLTGLFNTDINNALAMLINELNDASAIFKVKYGLILTVTRGIESWSHLKTLLQAYQNLGFPKEIVGLDLAGDEEVLIHPAFRVLFQNFFLNRTKSAF